MKGRNGECVDKERSRCKKGGAAAVKDVRQVSFMREDGRADAAGEGILISRHPRRCLLEPRNRDDL